VARKESVKDGRKDLVLVRSWERLMPEYNMEEKEPGEEETDRLVSPHEPHGRADLTEPKGRK
jgi:hypothetical protein